MAMRIAVVAFAAVIGAYYAGVYTPASDRLARERAAEQKLKQRFELITALRNNIDGYTERLREIRAAADEWGAIMPDELDPDERREQLERTAQTAGLQVKTLNVGKEESHDFYAVTPFQLRGAGDFTALYEVLWDTLDESQPPANVHSLNLTDAGDGSVDFAAKGIWYRYIPE